MTVSGDTMRVLVAGSRYIESPDLVYKILGEVTRRPGFEMTRLVAGDATEGVDVHAKAWATLRGIPFSGHRLDKEYQDCDSAIIIGETRSLWGRIVIEVMVSNNIPFVEILVLNGKYAYEPEKPASLTYSKRVREWRPTE
jgi:hypothetical protein